MNRLISFSILAVLVLGSAGIARMVQGYTADDLTRGTDSAYHMTSMVQLMTMTITACTNQMTAGQTANVDTCIHLMETFDKYVTQAVNEAGPDIKTITGLGFVS